MMLAAAYSPETINDALTEVEVVQGVTPARLQELARQYLVPDKAMRIRSEEHTSELQSLMRISYAVFCLKKKKKYIYKPNLTIQLKLTYSLILQEAIYLLYIVTLHFTT